MPVKPQLEQTIHGIYKLIVFSSFLLKVARWNLKKQLGSLHALACQGLPVRCRTTTETAAIAKAAVIKVDVP
jgi:hypothetical protein